MAYHSCALERSEAAGYHHLSSRCRCSQGRRLNPADYRALGRAAGVTSPDPGITLRRHYLLAMETPLNLLRRVDGRSWRDIRLTEYGVNLATASDTPAVFEEILRRMIFCREPWSPSTRVAQYDEFLVHPYTATLQVMEACEGQVDRDEYDLFVSRIRDDAQTGWAIEGILAFRALRATEKSALLNEVRRRIPGPKEYQNWRDMALHTFTLFGLGTSAHRADQRLVLTSTLVGRPAAGGIAQTVVRAAQPVRPTVELRIPTVGPRAELAVPPTAPAANPGTDGEILVGKLLHAAGWEVLYYGGRRGFGFDIWAKKDEAPMLVEVKSSFRQLGSLTLTRLEYEAARAHGPNYVLAVVENLATENPSVRLIADPLRHLRVEEVETREYRITRPVWAPAAEPFRPSM